MKNCSEIREWMYQYIDNQLDQATRELFEKHVDHCPECRDELDKAMQVLALCADIEEEELPADFRMKLHQKLVEIHGQEKKQEKFALLKNRYIKWISTAAACFAVLFLSYSLLSRNGGMEKMSKSDFESNRAMMAAGAESVKDLKAEESTEDMNISFDGQEKKQALMMAESFVPEDSGEKEETQRTENSALMSQRGTPTGAAAQGVEAILNNYVIVDEKPQSAVEKVMQLAIENGAVFDEPISLANSGKAGQAESGKDGKDEKEAKVLNFKLPKRNVEQFTNLLLANYSEKNVRVEMAPAFVQSREVEPPEEEEKTQDEEDEYKLKEEEKVPSDVEVTFSDPAELFVPVTVTITPQE